MTTLTRFRHSGTALAHSLSPTAWRSTFAMRPADAIFAPAMKVGIAAALVLVGGGLLGHGQLAGVASLGALASAFGRYQPYPRLARILALVAAALLISAGAGAFMGAANVPIALQIVALSLLAGIAAHLFSAFGITGPGAVILVFAASAGSGYAHTFDAVPQVIAAIAAGAAVGWLVAMAPVLVAPMGPARLAVARAIASVLRLGTDRLGTDGLGTDDAGTRPGAAAVPLRLARESVALSAGAVRTGSRRALRLQREADALNQLLDEASTARTLGGPGRAAALERLARHESELRRTWRTPAVAASAAAGGHAAPQGFVAAARGRIGSRESGSRALRMAAASALSGWAAVGLGLEHPLWASMGAVAALQGLNYSVTVQRGIQRLLGNVAGAVLALALLSVPLGFWPSVALVVAFQMVAELLVLTNYTLTTIAVTPMALIMTGLGSHLGPDAAVSRVADTLVGVVAGVLVAALSIPLSDRAHLAHREPAG